MKINKKKLILVSGGARSGKSTFAEEWAAKYGKKVLLLHYNDHWQNWK